MGWDFSDLLHFPTLNENGQGQWPSLASILMNTIRLEAYLVEHFWIVFASVD
jgi:hypothetical protein